MRVDRRTFLLGAAAVVAGCGAGASDPKIGRQTKALARRSVAIDYASYYAPIEDVRRLVSARAEELHAEVTFSDDAAGVDAQVANLRRWTGDQGGFSVVAVAPFDRSAVEPIAAGAIERGVAIVGYVTELEHQSAAITVDRGRAGALLAADARGHGGGVLLVRPPAQQEVPDPFAPGFADAEAAIRTTLDVRATVEAQAEADAQPAVAAALQGDPSLTTVLCWNDLTAIGAAVAAGRSRYVGGLGAPSLTGRAAIAALRRDGALQCLVAARLSDLADALVELPLALARGERAGSRPVPVAVLKPGSPKLKAFAADFGR
jgi:hypothetical protein